MNNIVKLTMSNRFDYSQHPYTFFANH